MTRTAVRARAILAVSALALLAMPAHAQINGMGPALSKLSGCLLWGSAGYMNPQHPERFSFNIHHPVVRGGFAALYGPFGGQPDTTVTLDSVLTTVDWAPHPTGMPGGTRIDTMRTVRTVYSRHTIPGRDGWVSLAVGYQYSGNYRVDLGGVDGTLNSTFPVGGFYAAALCGPFRVWGAPRALFWVAGLGGGIVQLSDANGRSDSTLVRFNTERALAPEASLMLGCRVHRGVRVIGGVSAQHIRWSAIRYRAPSEQPLPTALLRQLPTGLRLTSVHLTLGLGFDASELFAK